MNYCLVLNRSFSRSSVVLKQIPTNTKGKTASAIKWLTRQLNDPFVKMARYKNYRARSAFKLVEIDDKYKILSPGMIVVDCGAAPGAWTQVIVERLHLARFDGMSSPDAVNSKVISIDINAISPIEGAHILSKLDFTKPISQAQVLTLLDGKLADVICSDMAPNACGYNNIDHERQIALALSALAFATTTLKPKGTFLTKIWEGSLSTTVVESAKKFFEEVRIVKPQACHAESVETYVLAKYFKGVVK